MADLPVPASDPGPVGRLVAKFVASLADGTFVRLVLAGPTPGAGAVERIVGRLVRLRGEPAVSLTLREPRRDLTRNLPLADAGAWLQSELGARFRSARLETTSADWQLAIGETGPARLVRHRPRTRTVPERDHDHSPDRVLDDTAVDWLGGLGLVDGAGRALPSRADKVRQIHRFAEIAAHLVRDCGWPPGTALRVADLGCGRGYLTFAVWQLLHRQLGHDVTVTGLEARPGLVQECRALAARLGLAGLDFRAGIISETRVEPLDVLLALHACNTATDDAIRHGIAAGCRLILVAPCCHQEVRPQLTGPEPLAGALEHGLLAERFAEWLTDALRVHHLELAGYRVKVIEFVASEHTPRNVLIAGVRTGEPGADSRARERILGLRAMFGLRHHALDPLLGP